MIILSIKDLCKSYGTDDILKNIDLELQDTQKLGIVGPNGAGKSTLFKIIIGSIIPEKGSVTFRKGTSIGYLAQENYFDSSLTIWQEMLKIYEPVFLLENQIHEIEKQMGKLDTNTQEFKKISNEYEKLNEEFVKMDGYSYKSYIQGVLIGLGFNKEQFDQKVSNLSGGQKTRVALARLLLQKHDILLLDEPTNHLDLEAIEWLQDFLKHFNGAVITISHDRYFLDHLCDSTAEINFKTLTMYQCNYSQYIIRKQENIEQQTKKFELQQGEIKRQEAIIEKFRSFNREKSIKAAESRERALNKVVRLDKPQNEKDIHFRFTTTCKTGNDVLKIENLSMGFNSNTLFSNVNIFLKAGERAAIIGPNGCGKTTLFKILLNKLKPLYGSFSYGSNVDIGYYDQEQSDLRPDNTIMDEIWDSFPKLTQTEIRNALGSFLFQGDDVFKKISDLSGGEKGRVMLVKLMLAKNNLLLLDEPTNYLDIGSKECLEKSLRDYTGTILTISHDRYYINKIATKVLVLTKNGIKEFLGNYDDYIEKEKILNKKTDENDKEITKTALKEKKKKEREDQKLKRQQKEKVKSVEDKIEQTENEIKSIEKKMCDAETFKNPETAAEINIKYNQLKKDLEGLYSEWQDLIE